jgi:hypothetical protein
MVKMTKQERPVQRLQMPALVRQPSLMFGLN